jgi:ATP-dependent Lhr-like helicase
MRRWAAAIPAKPSSAVEPGLARPHHQRLAACRCAPTSPAGHARARASACRPAWPSARAAPLRPRRKAAGRCDRKPQSGPCPNENPAPNCAPTEASHALALQLLNRYGVLLRERRRRKYARRILRSLPVLKALEESGRIRRGYFVAGLGATQFALPAAVDLLRQLRTAPPKEKPEFVQLAATDPANPYGSRLRWPDLPVAEEDTETAPRVLTRAAYAEVILRNDAAGGVAAPRQS